MKVLSSIASLRTWRNQIKDHTVAFVPTMGNLHAGHLELVKVAQHYADQVIVSIFVNPTQFNQTQDFTHYPRTLEQDLHALEQLSCDACFTPSVEEMYPSGSQTSVSMGSLADHMCGATRPGHFDGVCTVVASLFHLVQCNWAIFGRKDFQQLAIIRQMVRDLHMPVKIIGVETVREHDGLAMSSRNHRLTADQRNEAVSIYQGLQTAHTLWQQGIKHSETLKQAVIDTLSSQMQVDYLTLCDPHTLQPIEEAELEGDSILAMAAFLGSVRLIDHIYLG